MNGDVSNSIHGEATLTVAVQARDIHGLHFHPVPPPRPVPRQLAAVPPTFTGREDVLLALDDILGHPRVKTAPVVVVTGPEGIGKHTLATTWAHQVASRYPDGQLVAHLRADGPGAPTPAAETARSLLRSLGLGDHAPLPWARQDLLGMWRSHSAGRQLLVLLKDAVCAEQVVPLVPAEPGCLVIVTSLSPIPGLAALGAHHQRLGPLTPAHAVHLLGRIVGEERVRAEPAAAEALARACGGVPLALGLAAGDTVLVPARPPPTPC